MRLGPGQEMDVAVQEESKDTGALSSPDAKGVILSTFVVDATKI